jgi:histidyl-tRNA synthetase
MSLLHGSEIDEMLYTKKAKFHDGGENLLSSMTFSRDSAFMNNLKALGAKFSINESFSIGVESVEQIERLVRSSGYGPDRIRISGTVVRGLEYYTGPVYEVELLIETNDEKGRPVRFGSVGGGGRYDGLVSRFRGEPVPATGFSIGVSRLQAALALIGKQDSQQKFGPVVVTIFDKERIADYQKIVATLRNANIRAELYLGNPKNNLGQQMKYADKRNSPCAIVQGSDEKAKGVVQIKDLIAGAGLSEIKDREEYLKQQAEAQQECSEADIVKKVREVLARHGVKTASA